MRPVLLATLALFAVAPGASAAPRQDPDDFTPIVPSVLAPPWPVEGSDGRFHVVYEVRLLNTIPLPWRVTRVTARSATGRGRVLASWAGPRVRDVMRSLADGRDTRRIGPGQGALLHLTFRVRARSRLPTSLVHELRLANPDPTNGAPARVVEIGARTKLVRRAPAVLGPPLQGDRWLAADGCCLARRHVRAFAPYGGGFNAQRFAIDWERLHPSGRLFVGDKQVLTNWAGYGESILAVADGTVVRAIDGLPNQVPGALPEGLAPLEADGNAVFLRLRDGRIVFYAHMIPGSVMVREGDRVVRGQLLGRVGNSGNSSAPHLHLHVIDRNAIFGANGLPYVFSRFDVSGRVASTEAFDRAEATGDPVQLRPVRTGMRRNKLPLDQVIVTWPG
jgi:murein DD-endopeptidase MepM/ murein hydrolase activator NlpD